VAEALPEASSPQAPLRWVDFATLMLLGALWGGSFLFMRIASPEFGSLALGAVRAGLASLILLPLLFMQSGGVRALMAASRRIALLSLINTSIPFVLFAFAALYLSTGASAILNAMAPFFAAIVAWLWMGERMSRTAILGLMLGFAGVAVLMGGPGALRGDPWMASLAAAGVLLATLGYGVAVNFMRHRLKNVSPTAVSTGCHVFGAMVLIPLGVGAWPASPPSAMAWASIIALAAFSTALAFTLYVRLIARIGPTRAVTSTFLSPAFGMLWGALFLDEPVTLEMVTGASVIILGVALTTGLLGRRP
jgi:drug/metabolite transporter (DMT)-like permease